MVHEQIHFDISEIYARKIRKRFSELNGAQVEDMNVYVEEYHRLIGGKDSYQTLFDSEVLFSDENLFSWKVKVKEEIERLKEFK